MYAPPTAPGDRAAAITTTRYDWAKMPMD